MGALFGNQPVYDPLMAAEHARLFRMRRMEWWEKANGYTCPVGVKSGHGHLLMCGRDLSYLDKNARHSLRFFDTRTGTDVTFKNITITSIDAITAGNRGDLNTLYHVQIADRRHLWKMYLLDAAFNMRVTPTGNFRDVDLTGGVAMSWQALVDAIWEFLPEASEFDSPTLPFSPDGKPEGFDFYGKTAGDALGIVLDRLGCTLVLDPIADTFRIARIGDAAAKLVLDGVLAQVMNVRLDDNGDLFTNLGRVPRSVTVLFPKEIEPAYGDTPHKSVEINDPGTLVDGQESGTTVILHDDLVARYQGGSLMNSAALTSRATERATDYFRILRKSGPVESRNLYSGARSEFTMGEWIDQIAWMDIGDGLMTEIRIEPVKAIVAWQGNRRQTWRETEIIRLTGTSSTVSLDVGTISLLNGVVLIRNDYTGAFSDHFDCYVLDQGSEIESGDTSKITGKLTGFAGTKPVYFLGSTDGGAASCRKKLHGSLSSISGYSAGSIQFLIKNADNCLVLVDSAPCS